MLRRSVVVLLLIFFVEVCAAHGADDRERAELVDALRGARVSLEAGLSVAEGFGRPISAEFEIVDGDLELTIYLAKRVELLDLTVDPRTGVMTNVEAIADGTELQLARGYRKAMLKATVPLRAAVQQAVRANPGFRAVSIVPALKDDQPVADVVLLKGDVFKEISVALE